jgi:hypothetical protein
MVHIKIRNLMDAGREIEVIDLIDLVTRALRPV